MTVITGPAASAAPRVLAAVVLAGLVGGALDIVSAMVVYGPVLGVGATPVSVLQSVASGLLGREAFDGGTSAALLGLGAHMGISLAAAALYIIASLRLSILNLRPIICGLLFGVAVYFVMNYVVVPLSASPMRPATTFDGFLIALSLNVFFFGLPIALIGAALLRPRR